MLKDLVSAKMLTELLFVLKSPLSKRQKSILFEEKFGVAPILSYQAETKMLSIIFDDDQSELKLPVQEAQSLEQLTKHNFYTAHEAGLELVLTAEEDAIIFRAYQITLMPSGRVVPSDRAIQQAESL